MQIYFEEQNVATQKESSRNLIAHGLYKEVTTKDFPPRGHNVYLHLKQRKKIRTFSRQFQPKKLRNALP